MYRRLYRHAAALSLLPLCAGCVQSTRHSNTMIFGTNTNFGIKVGTDVAQVPGINIGYTRQEAVIMPLVANTVDQSSGQNGMNRLGPCDIKAGSYSAQPGLAPIHPCLLVATNGKASDSYSVLASFGAQFDASAGAGAEAGGGLAQYFATGVAAQVLALTGGASVVSTGKAAEEAAKLIDVDQSIKALYGDDKSFLPGIAIADDFSKFKEDLAANIQLTDPIQLVAKFKAFEDAAKPTKPLLPRCTSVEACKQAARTDQYLLDFLEDKQRFQDALTGW